MRRIPLLVVPLLVLLIALLLAGQANASRSADGWVLVKPAAKQTLVYGHSWGYYDVFIAKASWLAGRTFGVSADWLTGCNHDEGGDVGRRLLARTLHHPLYRRGDGWNAQGSRAFGPWQFMLDRKPAPSPADWGTFEKYMGAAFDLAHRRGLRVSAARFRRPDSYLGQALVTAFMFRIGQSHQWTGARC